MSITRSEVIKRAATIWPLGHVPYSQMTVRNPGWRTDCSGYVSMCLDLPGPGLTTVTLVEDGYIHEITPDELRPGDLVGRCGPGTGGDAGHVVVFDRWDQGHVTYWAYEFHGGPQLGPEHSLIHYPYHGLDGYRAYRYKEIADGAEDAPGGHWATVTAWPDPMSTISGIAAHARIADWHTLWDDPHNAGLRAHRTTRSRPARRRRLGPGTVIPSQEERITMTTVSAPVWAPWTSYYDSAGQAPGMVTNVAGDNLSVQFMLDRLTLSLQGGQDAPFAGAAGLSGALSVNVPPDFSMLGFLLVVNGHLEKTAKSQAVVTCSIGHGTQSQSWPLGIPSRDRDPVTGSDLSLECFTSDYNPAMVGVPPYPPLPPFPVTLNMQARRRTADEAIVISITDFTVILIGSS